MTTPAEQRERELARSHNASMPSPFSTKVVGVTFVNAYPDNLYALRSAQWQAEESGEPLAVVLIRNPANAHDSNAVQVHVPALGEDWAMVGLLTAPIAARLAPEMDAGGRWKGEVESVLVDERHVDRPGISIRCARVPEDA